MRILMLSPHRSVRGPLPKHTPLLVAALRDLGHEVAEMSWGRRRERESLGDRALGRVADIARTRRAVRQGRLDVLLVKTAHDWATLGRDIALLLAVRRLGPRVVLQFHGSRADWLAEPGHRLFKLASAWLVRLADGVLVLSSEEQRHWQAFCPSCRFRVVENPWVPPAGEPASRPDWLLRLSPGQPVILFVGRLIPEKGIFLLLEAVARLSAAIGGHLLVVGDGPHAARAHERAAILGLADRVTFTGYLEGDELAAAYRAAAALALPTVWDEGFPTVIGEAMGFGLPIVTTRRRGMADHLREDVNAVFVPGGDVPALAGALERLLGDPPLRAAMARANRKKVEEFAPALVGRRYAEALSEVLGGRAGRASRATRPKAIRWLKDASVGDALLRRNPIYYRGARRLLERMTEASLEERQGFTEERLAAILRAAARTGYGRRMAAGTRVSEWPLLERTAVRDDPESFLAVAAWRTASASTGGTTGIPLRLYRSPHAVTVEQAAIDRVLLAAGASPARSRFAVLRGDDIKDPADLSPPFWTLAGGGRRLVLSSNHLRPATVAAFAEAMTRFRPDVLLAYPTVLESFCRLLRAESLDLRVPLVVTSSEVLTHTAWQVAMATLGGRVVDHYGQAERVAFAYALAPEEFWFQPGYACVELVPVSEDGEHILYEIVGTSLWNLAMPLVRYRSGDLIRLPRTLGAAGLEAVRYGLRPFPGVLGRAGDFLVSPDGARLMGIDHLPRGVRNILRMQVVQEAPDHVRILVVPTPAYGGADERDILRNAAGKLPPGMRVGVEVVEELERTPGAKTPFVIRKFPAAESAAGRAGGSR